MFWCYVVGEVFLVNLCFFVWLEFCFSVSCGDFEMFVPWTFLWNLDITWYWVFLRYSFWLGLTYECSVGIVFGGIMPVTFFRLTWPKYWKASREWCFQDDILVFAATKKEHDHPTRTSSRTTTQQSDNNSRLRRQYDSNNHSKRVWKSTTKNKPGRTTDIIISAEPSGNRIMRHLKHNSKEKR